MESSPEEMSQPIRRLRGFTGMPLTCGPGDPVDRPGTHTVA